VIFGDSVEGARLPTGEANIGATYRQGAGAGGDLGRPSFGDRNDAQVLPGGDVASGAPSFPRGCLLDYPHFTRPAEFRGWNVPEVLIGGNHAEVAKWRRAAALEKTRRMRPELLLK
jgi:tRNA (guanine37-N1)-methyltransferase